MTQQTDIPEEIRAELNGLLDAEIENRLSIFSEKKRQMARAYLEERQANRVRAAQFEQTEIARGAKDAAWESAKAAKSANTLATIAIVISIISAMIAAATYIAEY
jgi:hypothetical protein